VYDVFSIANHIKKTGDAMAGALTNIDIDGTELVLDADGDTSITADTDDQIDIRIGGADDFAFKANKFEVQTGSNIDMNGTELILDADGDTSITADTDDQIDIKIGGTDIVTFTNSSSNFVITQAVQDKSITFKGDDNGSPVTALILDMADAGTAVFNHDITLDGKITGASQVTQDVDTSSLALAGGTDSNVGANMIVYGGSHSSLAGVVRFRNGSTETARILSGGGITFNGDTATANALDDYEEGTWVPALTGPSSVAYSSQIGNYTKIGRMVFLSFSMTISTAPTGNSNYRIPIPFTPEGTSTREYGGDIFMDTALVTSNYGHFLGVYLGTTNVYVYTSAGSARSGSGAWQTGTLSGHIFINT
jgi:hypothetical protein